MNERYMLDFVQFWGCSGYWYWKSFPKGLISEALSGLLWTPWLMFLLLNALNMAYHMFCMLPCITAYKEPRPLSSDLPLWKGQHLAQNLPYQVNIHMQNCCLEVRSWTKHKCEKQNSIWWLLSKLRLMSQ